MNNKRGQLSIILVIIVALALCAVALFIFLTFNKNFTGPGQERIDMISALQFEKDYIIQSVKLSAKDAINQPGSSISSAFGSNLASHNAGIDGTANFFAKVREGQFTFLQSGNNYEFKTSGVMVYSKIGDNEARSTFDVDITFDNKGNVVSETMTPASA